MNTIWFILIVISLIFSIFNNKAEVATKSIFEAAKSAIDVSLYLLGIISVWLGITKILEDANLINRISKFFNPIICKLFKKIPKNHISITSITLNLLANFFGLGNAATPLGIKAMNELQTLNEEKDTITFEMMLFIIINTASIQLIPFSVVGILSEYGSNSPTSIVFPTIVSTVISAITAVLILFLLRKFFDKKL
ncbi:MAG: spore maturation protein [Endomicrobia bacterium]|nr:spore maturation protein [Endomicrobiia bacterium]